MPFQRALRNVWELSRQGALNLALTSNHLEVALELLLWGWRHTLEPSVAGQRKASLDPVALVRKASVAAGFSFNHPMQVFTREQVRRLTGAGDDHPPSVTRRYTAVTHRRDTPP